MDEQKKVTSQQKISSKQRLQSQVKLSSQTEVKVLADDKPQSRIGSQAILTDETQSVVTTESGITTDSSIQPGRERRRRRRRRRKRSPEQNFDEIPGIKRVTLSHLTQKVVGCVVGDEVTGEKPWITVKKELVQDNLELHEGSSEFLPLKDEITKFPREDILIGYIPAEAAEEDEFYLCVTEEAHDKVLAIIVKQQEEQEKRLNNTIYRKIKKWRSVGSEKEVNDGIIRNNRPLIEVEMEAAYPIMSDSVTFRFRKVEDARDGYVEILCSRAVYQNVYRKRIDVGSQIAPPVRHSQAQTVCTYPKNAWTQYEYKFRLDETPGKNYEKSIKEYIEDNMEEFFDTLRVNFHINLYLDDYQLLVLNEKFSKVMVVSWAREYMTCSDNNVCKDKMITCICWSPFWTGTVAIAYGDIAPTCYVTDVSEENEVYSAVHGVNPVLLWCFNDGLNPKLYLETYREVGCISFCPYDENILVGGCINGQIIIWDIRNKLKYVEEEEILTHAQQKYRALMHSLMSWMKNIHDLSIVRTTALSDLEYSHKTYVTAIEWISPFWKVSKTGQLREIPEDSEERSLQFATVARDGTMLFWDLLSKPTVQPGGYRPQKRLRRLKKRPSALTFDVSPFRALNRLLKPSYKVDVRRPTDERNFQITSLNYKFESVDYFEKDPVPNRKFKLTNRIIHYDIPKRPTFETKSEFVAGTTQGDVLVGTWEGFDYNSGEVVNSENCKITSLAKYHDGPVVSLSRLRGLDVILSVGGKIFALWKIGLNNRPVMWRRCSAYYTSGRFCRFRNSMFKLTRDDGCIEVWHLLDRSDGPIGVQSISGEALTGCSTHELRMKQNIIGMSESNGSYRLFFVPSIFEDTDGTEYLLKLIDREIERKKDFLAWQDEWNERYATWIREKREQAILQQKTKELEAEIEKQREEEEAAVNEKGKKGEEKQKQQPGHYSLWEKEQWIKREEDRMNRVLLAKKHLDKDLLEKQQIPLQKMEAEAEHKQQRKEERLHEAQKIFQETVAMFFPEAIKEKPIPPPDPYETKFEEEDKEASFENYMSIIPETDEMVDTHPFRYTFQWNSVLQAGRERRTLLDNASNALLKRMERHQWYKHFRAIAEEEAEKALLANTIQVEVKPPSLGSDEFGFFGDEDIEAEPPSEEIQEAEPALEDVQEEKEGA